MQRKLLHVVIALLLISLCFAATAQAAITTLTSTLTAQTLTVNCTFTPLTGALNQFTYQLSNPLTNLGLPEPAHIRGFALQFPGVSTADFAVTQTPVGWFSSIIPNESLIRWAWNGSSVPDSLDPGETFTFAFTTALPFGGDVTANSSAQNGFGFSGKTCGPVIPEPMSMMLGLMGLGSVLGLRRFKK